MSFDEQKTISCCCPFKEKKSMDFPLKVKLLQPLGAVYVKGLLNKKYLSLNSHIAKTAPRETKEKKMQKSAPIKELQL